MQLYVNINIDVSMYKCHGHFKNETQLAYYSWKICSTMLKPSSTKENLDLGEDEIFRGGGGSQVYAPLRIFLNGLFEKSISFCQFPAKFCSEFFWRNYYFGKFVDLASDSSPRKNSCSFYIVVIVSICYFRKPLL